MIPSPSRGPRPGTELWSPPSNRGSASPFYVSRYCHLTGALGAALTLMDEGVEESAFRGIELHEAEDPGPVGGLRSLHQPLQAERGRGRRGIRGLRVPVRAGLRDRRIRTEQHFGIRPLQGAPEGHSPGLGRNRLGPTSPSGFRRLSTLRGPPLLEEVFRFPGDSNRHQRALSGCGEGRDGTWRGRSCAPP